MLRPTYPLVTERLLIRPFTIDDLDDVAAYRSLSSVARYVYWDPIDPDGVRALLRDFVTRTELLGEGAITLAIELDKTVIGETVLFWRSREHLQGEIGYVLNPAYNGRGYATEAAREMLRLGFDELGLHRIFGRIDARNDASARVLERLGMRREAHLIENEMVKGEWTDEMVYAMLRREWDAMAGQRTGGPSTGMGAPATGTGADHEAD
jgi:RimJ/RimL family protein N-acetyltransferase